MSNTLSAGLTTADFDKVDKRSRSSIYRQRHRDATVRLQSHYRGDKARKEVRQLRASIALQRVVRGYNVRKDLDAVIFGWAAYDNVVTTLKNHVKNTPGMDVHQLFSDLDVDEGGDFSLYELQKFFTMHPTLQLDSTAAEALMYHIDSGRDGKVSKREFLRAFFNHKAQVGKIKKKWEQHEELKRRRASDFHRQEYQKAKDHAERLKTSADHLDKATKFNVDQMTKYKKLVSKHSAKHKDMMARKKKRILSGHASYREEMLVARQSYARKSRRNKEAAIQRLRDANATTQYEPSRPLYGYPSATSPRNRRIVPSSPATSVASSNSGPLSDNPRLINTWKPVYDDKRRKFWQNVTTKEVAWSLPTGSTIDGMNGSYGRGHRLNYAPVFKEISSESWKFRNRSKKVKSTPKSLTKLTVLTDDMLSVSSIKYFANKGRNLFSMT